MTAMSTLHHHSEMFIWWDASLVTIQYYAKDNWKGFLCSRFDIRAASRCAFRHLLAESPDCKFEYSASGVVEAKWFGFVIPYCDELCFFFFSWSGEVRVYICDTVASNKPFVHVSNVKRISNIDGCTIGVNIGLTGVRKVVNFSYFYTMLCGFTWRYFGSLCLCRHQNAHL
jgi:hypothetical protein